LKAQMETSLEQFYRSAHRVVKLAQSTARGTNIKPMGVITVRNHLIEHPKPGALYSFGWCSEGPRVKPSHKPDQEWHDAGLIANAGEFARALLKCYA
jgi:hypothetical protein